MGPAARRALHACVQRWHRLLPRAASAQCPRVATRARRAGRPRGRRGSPICPRTCWCASCASCRPCSSCARSRRCVPVDATPVQPVPAGRNACTHLACVRRCTALDGAQAPEHVKCARKHRKRLTLRCSRIVSGWQMVNLACNRSVSGRADPRGQRLLESGACAFRFARARLSPARRLASCFVAIGAFRCHGGLGGR